MKKTDHRFVTAGREADKAGLDRQQERVSVTKLEIGTRLKHARLTKGMSLLRLAREVGCTESFLSKVEHDKVRPSLTMLHRIVAALEINIARLFNEEAGHLDPVSIMHEGARPFIKTDGLRRGPGISLERLVSGAQARLLQANIHHVAPRGSSDGCIEHIGEEMGYVLEGMLEFIVDGKAFVLKKGDSFFFNSSLPHGYRNIGKSEARVLWVNTPPNF
jgi:transcriptional regulator with XRE-family HTH domain